MSTPARIKQIRERLNLSQSEFYEKTGMQQSTVSLIESGGRKIGKRAAEAIITKLNVNPRWWVTGEGDMFSTQPERSIPVYSFGDIEGVIIDSIPVSTFNKIDRIVEYTGEAFGKVQPGCQLFLKMTSIHAAPENSILLFVMTKGASAIGNLVSHTDDEVVLQKNSTPFTVKKRGIKQVYRVEFIIIKCN